MSIEQKELYLKDQQLTHLVLSNQSGMKVELINWGATLVDVCVPDRQGVVESVTLAYADMNEYIANPSYLGCIIGRVAGRIANSRFHLNGHDYDVPSNEGLNQLHGGSGAMSHQMWAVADTVDETDRASVRFEYISPAGENGYPANLKVSVTYILTADNILSIKYDAVADAPTLCNLTNHAYFNLSGNMRSDVTQHQLQVNADSVCMTNDELLVTGEESNVTNSTLDFRIAKPLSEVLHTSGIDHYFVLNPAVEEAPPQVVLLDTISGRRLSVWSDQACAVLYAHSYANGEKLRHNAIAVPYDSLCIETQKLPHVWTKNGNHPMTTDQNHAYTQRTDFKFDCI